MQDRNEMEIQRNEPEFAPVETARAMKEVEAQILLSKRFPRDIYQVSERVEKLCSRMIIAEKSEYLIPIQGKSMQGPSIHLAKAVAQVYQNIDYGVRQVGGDESHSMMEAYCWDMENNVRRSKTFRIDHIRYSKKGGRAELHDPSDIDRIISNRESRQLRNCILSVIPSDVIEEAVQHCRNTRRGKKAGPIEDQIKKVVNAFSNLSSGKVTKEMIEERLGHSIDEVGVDQVDELRQIYFSLRDGQSKRSDWFSTGEKENENTPSANALNAIIEPEIKEDAPVEGIKEIIKILDNNEEKSCAGCPNLDHTGAFTVNGALNCCMHKDAIKDFPMMDHTKQKKDSKWFIARANVEGKRPDSCPLN